jgi:hypothetical protein
VLSDFQIGSRIVPWGYTGGEIYTIICKVGLPPSWYVDPKPALKDNAYIEEKHYRLATEDDETFYNITTDYNIQRKERLHYIGELVKLLTETSPKYTRSWWVEYRFVAENFEEAGKACEDLQREMLAKQQEVSTYELSLKSKG